jgi:uncharacterized membrane protein
MQALLPVHIVAGGLAIVVGAVALAAAKGAWLHRKSGAVFVAAMLTMGLSGSALALRDGLNPNALGGFMSAYLVVTAWATVHPLSVGARQLVVGAMLVALALGLLDLVLGIVAVGSPHRALGGVPAPAFFIFAIVGLLAAAGDFRVIRAGTGALRGAARLRRHLWRMCFALFIAAGSFFSIRSRVARILPEPFLGPGMRVLPIVLPLLLMAYWLWRVRGRRVQMRFGEAGARATT